MRQFLKKFSIFLFVLLLAAGAAWIVWPQGSRINLNKIGINYQQDFTVHLGLDLQGGAHLVYQADFSELEEADKEDALQSARDTIERRVNAFGVSEPLVQIQGSDQIVVELPGVSNINEAIDLIGQTPLLEFKVQGDPGAEPTPVVNEDGTISLDASAGWESTGLSGKQLKRATADVQGGAGSNVGSGNLNTQLVVRLEFDQEGSDLFAQLTEQHLGEPIGIFLDGQLLSAPTVQSVITNGEAVISGQFTADEAKNLATRLNSGALPVPIKLVSQQNVGASLGQESVERSLIAGIIGLIMVGLFMLFYYRFPGLLALFALIIYTLISIAIFKIGISISAVVLVGVFFILGIAVRWYFGILALISYVVLMFLGGLSPVTLTLAGIAGFILSVGMAVDANILIFERTKEELRSGKNLHDAIEDGFARAWLSIRDSNVSSLITTLILYIFGTPSIKGFAVTLSIGILISMFSAITVTRTFIRLFVTGRILSHPWLFGVKMKDQSDEKGA